MSSVDKLIMVFTLGCGLLLGLAVGFMIARSLGII